MPNTFRLARRFSPCALLAWLLFAAVPQAYSQEEFVGPFPSWRNAKTQCGATGNGATDDTSALQNCINGLNGLYDVVYLPPGTYKISSTLQVTYKQYFTIVGADPSSVTIKWSGGGGGTMMHVNGGFGTHWGRITWDGSSSAGIGVAHKWDFGGGVSSTNIEHFDEVFKNMAKGIVAGAPPGDNDDTITIRRTTFTGITDTGISSETQNALNLMCWDCTFANNARGMANDRAAILGGNIFAYRCLFQNSSVADVEFANPSSFISVRWSTSSGSNRFIYATNEGQNGGALTAQGNTVLDTADAAAIEIGNVGIGIIIDNKIRSASGNTGPAVVMDPGNGAAGSDLISVGNQYTVSPGVSVSGSPTRSWSQEDSTVSRSSIGSSLPIMPPTPVNMSRQIFEVASGANASTIQAAINNASALHSKAVVHIPPGNYAISSGLSFPAGSDVQLIGDGYYSSLDWSGPGGGKLLQVSNGSKVTIQDIELDGGGHNADGIEIDTEDTTGSRVWIDNSYQDHAGTDSIFADSLARTAVTVTAPWLANDSGANVKITGNGSPGSSYLAIFGATTAYNGAGSDPMYEVANGGQLLVEDAWWEGSSTLINPTSSGTFTYNGGHISPQAGIPHPIVSEQNFAGSLTLLGLDTDFHHNGSWNYTFGSGISSTNVLVAGVQCCLFDQNVSGGAPTWLVRSGSGGSVIFINNKNSGNDGDWQLGDSGTGRTSGAIDNSLALLRNTRPVTDPPTPTSAGVTDVQIYRTHIFNPQIGLHIKAAAVCTFVTPATLPGGTVQTAYNTAVSVSNCPSSSYTVTSGGLPPGLSLSGSSGAITGTPTSAGTFSFTVTYSSTARLFSITIAAACTITTSSPLSGGTVGTPYTVTLASTGCTGLWSATGLPGGLSISSGGVISGTPNTPGIASVVAAIAGKTKTLSLTISPAAQPSKLCGVTLRGITLP
jgi:Pectate lyase superfamily protein/Putative Ig domain